jgi:hypothetical protein
MMGGLCRIEATVSEDNTGKQVQIGLAHRAQLWCPMLMDVDNYDLRGTLGIYPDLDS